MQATSFREVGGTCSVKFLKECLGLPTIMWYFSRRLQRHRRVQTLSEMIAIMAAYARQHFIVEVKSYHFSSWHVFSYFSAMGRDLVILKRSKILILRDQVRDFVTSRLPVAKSRFPVCRKQDSPLAKPSFSCCKNQDSPSAKSNFSSSKLKILLMPSQDSPSAKSTSPST